MGMNQKQNNDDANNNDMSERRQGSFDSLDLLTEREETTIKSDAVEIAIDKTEALRHIKREIDEIRKEIHKIEIERLNRKWDENLRHIAEAVEEYVQKNFITTDEELDELRALVKKEPVDETESLLEYLQKTRGNIVA
jgi:hypothetical protein